MEYLSQRSNAFATIFTAGIIAGVIILATKKITQKRKKTTEQHDIHHGAIVEQGKRLVWKVKPQAGSLENLVLETEDFDAEHTVPLGLENENKDDGVSGNKNVNACYATIENYCSGLNFADVFAVQGLYSATPKGEFIPGLEFCGVIKQIHCKNRNDNNFSHLCSDCAQFKEDDRIMGVTRFGGYTSMLNASISYIHPLPADYRYQEGAAVLVQALTAYYGLVELAQIEPNQTILIHSAAGGVGLYAVWICQALGLNKIIATIGDSNKLDVLLKHTKLNQNQIIVRNTAKQFDSQLKNALHSINSTGIDCVFDSLGGEYFNIGYKHLNGRGKIIIFGAGNLAVHSKAPFSFFSPISTLKLVWNYLQRPKIDPLELVSANKAIIGFNLIWLWNETHLLKPMLNKLFNLNLPKPLVNHEFAFSKAKLALEFMLSGKSAGKIVLNLKK